MKKIKEFLKRKSTPPGHTLGRDSAPAEASSSSSSSSTSASVKLAAAEAAQRRQAQQLEKTKVRFPRTYLPPPEKVVEEPDKIKWEEPENKIKSDESAKFNCPALEIFESSSLASLKEQIMKKIKANFGEDPIICGSLLIRNCNPEDKKNVCISTLEVILKNLQTEDEEEFQKYTKLRKNKIENKILSANGGFEFLSGAGFTLSEDGEWFVFKDSRDDLKEKLLCYLDVLSGADVFPIALDRETCVYDLNALNTPNIAFDDEIFNMTKDELTKEQQTLTQVADTELTLMTKAMREKLINRKPKTRFTRLRYKRLDLKMIEATFRTNETVRDFIEWLKEHHSMDDIETYDITCGTQIIPIEDWNKTFLDLNFYPKVTFYQKLKSANT